MNPTLNRTLSKGKRPASDEDDDDDDIIIDDSRVTSAGSSSVEEESEQRRRRRKMNNDSLGAQPQNGDSVNQGGGTGGGMEMSEEDMMAKAIEESLRVSRINPGEQSASEAGGSSGATSARVSLIFLSACLVASVLTRRNLFTASIPCGRSRGRRVSTRFTSFSRCCFIRRWRRRRWYG